MYGTVGVASAALLFSSCASVSGQETIDTGLSAGLSAVTSQLMVQINTAAAMPSTTGMPTGLASAAQTVVSSPTAVPQGFSATMVNGNVQVNNTVASPLQSNCIVLSGTQATSRSGPC